VSGAQWGDVPTWIAAGAALAAFVFGLVSVLQVQRGRREERDFARDGVAAMWQASEASGPDVDGKSTSRYVFTVVIQADHRSATCSWRWTSRSPCHEYATARLPIRPTGGGSS